MIQQGFNSKLHEARCLLYKRAFPFIDPSVGPSVGPLVYHQDCPTHVFQIFILVVFRNRECLAFETFVWVVLRGIECFFVFDSAFCLSGLLRGWFRGNVGGFLGGKRLHK